LDHPERAQVTKAFTAPAEAFSAARERCNVRIGNNVFEGDLTHYRVHVELDEVCVDIDMKTTVPCLRPASTGHVFFGEDEALYVAWLPAVLRADVTARIAIDGHTETLRGTGYHDHNWGNAALRKLVDHWYRGRARLGDYTLVTLMFFSHENYGKLPIPAFMLAKGDKVIAAGSENVRFVASDMSVNEQSCVPVAKRLVYEIELRGELYKLTYHWRKDIHMLDFGKAGAYYRFLGEATLEHHAHGRLSDSAQAEAIWEMLYFGPRVPVSLAVNDCVVASVCAGAFFLAEAGLLGGHRATLNPLFADAFRAAYCVLRRGAASRTATGRRRSGALGGVDNGVSGSRDLFDRSVRWPRRRRIDSQELNRRFRSATGFTPLEYLHRLRIEAAKRLLETSNLSVDEITGAVGYGDSRSFSRLFRSSAGLSPSEYRQRFGADFTAWPLPTNEA
jgi:hypothetical protein